MAQTFADETGTDAASRTLGIVSPAAEEYRRLGIDADALASYAAAGRGRQLPLASEETPTSVWAHDIEASAFPTPIWPWLLLLAIALVPIDVGVRRVALSRADFRRARAWAARRVGMGRAEPEAVAGLAELRAARDRGVRRADRAVPPPPAATVEPQVPPAGPPHVAPPPAAPTPSVVPTKPRPQAQPTEPGRTDEPVGETLAERLARRRREG